MTPTHSALNRTGWYRVHRRALRAALRATRAWQRQPDSVDAWIFAQAMRRRERFTCVRLVTSAGGR
jgi:hypothetical protein